MKKFYIFLLVMLLPVIAVMAVGGGQASGGGDKRSVELWNVKPHPDDLQFYPGICSGREKYTGDKIC